MPPTQATMLHKTLLSIAVLSISFGLLLSAQGFPEKAILKRYKGKTIEMDAGNEDGVFKMQLRKSQKWGMYQWMYEGTKCNELIPMQFDSLRFFPFNGNFTAVYQKGKVGFYLAKWTYDDLAKQSVACLYDDYQRYRIKGVIYLAVQKGEKWAWIDWLTGEEKSDFSADTHQALPAPNYEQKQMFD